MLYNKFIIFKFIMLNVKMFFVVSEFVGFILLSSHGLLMCCNYSL